MTAFTTHRSFPSPSDPEATIWRYMDLPKFISLLATSSLYFSRIDRLSDPYEGATTMANWNMYTGSQSAEGKRLWARQWYFVNCWHRNDTEAYMMWKAYANASESIAIRSRYSTLARCLPEEGGVLTCGQKLGSIYLGCVSYLDYERDQMNSSNEFSKFMHKRRYFEHENEVRALTCGLPTDDEKHMYDYSKSNDSEGILIPIELNELIEAVHVAPTTADWFVKALEDVCKKYELRAPVLRSSLDTPLRFM